jgi:PAS domain S-box-containing protein
MQPMIPTPSPSHQLHLSGWTYQRDVGPWRSGTTTVSQINWAREGEPYYNRPLEGVATLERAFAGGTAHRVGWYRFYFSDERWEWSPEVEQIHGYQPGTVTPTTQLVLSHKHPADYAYVAATLEDIRQSHRPFSSRHRIITVQGDTRDIVVIGERLHDNSGEVIGTHGFYIDVTRSSEAREATISEAVAEFAEHRAAIEQAKGVLMYIYRIDSAAAFDLLKWRSQETNTKLRTLAEQLLADVHTLKQTTPQIAPPSTDYYSPRTNAPKPTRTVVDSFILSQPRPVARQGKNNKRESMPSQIRSRMSSNSGVSAVLICTWSPTAA